MAEKTDLEKLEARVKVLEVKAQRKLPKGVQEAIEGLDRRLKKLGV